MEIAKTAAKPIQPAASSVVQCGQKISSKLDNANVGKSNSGFLQQDQYMNVEPSLTRKSKTLQNSLLKSQSIPKSKSVPKVDKITDPSSIPEDQSEACSNRRKITIDKNIGPVTDPIMAPANVDHPEPTQQVASDAPSNRRVVREARTVDDLNEVNKVANKVPVDIEEMGHGENIVSMEPAPHMADDDEDGTNLVMSPVAVVEVVSLPVVKATRATTANNAYDDKDEAQNELIAMERKYVNGEKEKENDSKMSEREKMKQYQRDCERCSLPPPLDLEKFQKIDWNYVSVCDETRLAPGYKFKTVEELKAIPRRHPRFPFCHPGPVRDEDHNDGWYYTDSIVQELKFIGRTEKYYQVRWIGYEDIYNTLETESCLRGKAILIMFERKDIFVASQESGSLLLRRSVHNRNYIHRYYLTKSVSENESFVRVITLLDGHLKEQERLQRYMPEIGFYSSVNLNTALKFQLEFTATTFMNIIKDLQRPDYYVGSAYMGSVIGGRCDEKLLKDFKNVAFNKAKTLRNMIDYGLKTAKFASFLVMTKRAGKATDHNLNLHMCVYTIRSDGDHKDSIYFDPAAPCHKRSVPDFLLELRRPQLRSATQISGMQSEKNDCFYQCLKYIIALQTGEIEFQPNLKSKYFRVKK